MSSPDIPPPPPPPQESKQPDQAQMSANMRRNRVAGGMAGGSLLTGPSGVAAGAPTGRATLLGQ
jgi:hypothetical protein